MRHPSPKHWFRALPPGPAARFLANLECASQYDWRLITRTSDGRLALQVGADPEAGLPFGQRRQDIDGAIRALNRQLSPEIFRRLNNDRDFRNHVLIGSAQALLDNDVALSKGLMRRLVDATIGFETLAEFVEGHPKSLIRMLSRNGNPSAWHLAAILSRLTWAHGVRLKVMVAGNG